MLSADLGSYAGAVDNLKDGLSKVSAVPVDRQHVISSERKWLNDHYPEWTMLSQAFDTEAHGTYDVIRIQSPSGEEREIYFDITPSENEKKEMETLNRTWQEMKDQELPAALSVTPN